MTAIICAVRGGPASQPTIEAAIKLAKETNLKLNFLYVVNLDFLSHTRISRTSIISEELHEMGEFILLTAQEKAKSEGVEVEPIIRHGNVSEEIINLAKELQASYVILGLPIDEKEERNVFLVDRIREFGKLIEEQSGAKVILAGGESS
jgi:nucleotide-binding universal stress UspA family protein